MGKKFLTGLTLGSLAGLAAWTSLDEKQQQQIKAKVSQTVYTTMDLVTDYTLNALDVADAMIHDYGEDATTKVKNWKDAFKNKKEQLTDHFVSDDFDAQTADLRDALKNAKSTDDDDIIIDKTNDEKAN